MEEAVAHVADALAVECCAALELLPGGGFRLAAGVGWGTAVPGAEVDPALESQARYALASEAPVVVSDRRRDARLFDDAALRRDYRAVSGVSAVIDPERPYGVLGAYTARRRRFTDEEACFARGVAGLLAVSWRRERERRLAEAAEERTQTFIEALAHDARTPLTAIVGFARTLDDHWSRFDDEQRRGLLGEIGEGARRLERLMVDLLALVRTSRTAFETRRELTDVSHVIEQAVVDVGARRRTTIAISGPSTAHVDRLQLGRIVGNLLVNALRHTPPETPIWVSAGWEGSGLLLTVSDAGAGVPDDLKEEIFEPYRRGGDSTDGGTGVGLALVARFAQLHGGRAWVEDRPGGGATFRVLLAAAGVVNPRGRSRSSRAGRRRRRRRGRRIPA